MPLLKLTNNGQAVCALVLIVAYVHPLLAVPPADILAEMAATKFIDDASEAFSSSISCPPETFTFDNVNFRGQLTRCDFGADGNTSPNDLWGFVSKSGRRYAIIGLGNRTVFVEVTDPENPVILGKFQGGASPWRDMKVHGNYAYIVRQVDGTGIQIADLSDIDNGVITLANESTLGGFFSTAHNIAYNPDSEFFYLCSSNINGGVGLVAVDPTSDPVNPVIAGFWNTGAGVKCHDAFVVNYDTGIYAGREIAFCFAGTNGLYIGDVTNKNNMFTLGTLTNSSWVFTHQGWISDDHRHLFLGDEFDEQQNLHSTRTYAINIENLNQPVIGGLYKAISTMTAIDHNMMTVGNYLFQANYSGGLRILDVSNVSSIFQAGFFDTIPSNDLPGFQGAWGVYAGFGDGMVLISDMTMGLFVLDATPLLDIPAMPSAALFPSGTKKNRYISFINNFGGSPGNFQVRRFRDNAPPEVVGWVGMPDARGISTIVPNPPNPPIAWPTLIVEAGDCEIIPATTYQVFATNDNHFFTDPFTIQTSGDANGVQTWGDVTGKFLNGLVWLPSDDKVDVRDIVAVLQGVTMQPLSAGADRLDLAPEIPDGIIDDLDLQMIVDAFESQPYPFVDPSGCSNP